MKTTIFYLTIIFSVLIIGCEKEDQITTWDHTHPIMDSINGTWYNDSGTVTIRPDGWLYDSVVDGINHVTRYPEMYYKYTRYLLSGGVPVGDGRNQFNVYIPEELIYRDIYTQPTMHCFIEGNELQICARDSVYSVIEIFYK
jgi:hypothetical protein